MRRYLKKSYPSPLPPKLFWYVNFIGGGRGEYSFLENFNKYGILALQDFEKNFVLKFNQKFATFPKR